MTALQRLRLQGRNFRRETEGSMPIEGLLAFCFLVWWYVASYQFFDGFRQKNVNLKAAYTIADLISRETGYDPNVPGSVPVDQNYINGLNKVFDYLTFSNRPTWIRVTSIKYDDTNKKYVVHWSHTSDPTRPVHTDASINREKDRLPVLPPGDSVILVETSSAYNPIFTSVDNSPFFASFLPASWLNNFIVTRPRFASCVPWDTNGSC